jgi:hypothetical protein
VEIGLVKGCEGGRMMKKRDSSGWLRLRAKYHVSAKHYLILTIIFLPTIPDIAW